MSVHARFLQRLAAHYARYPLMQLDDVYKLVHQACWGNAHAALDAAVAHQWLLEELASLGAGPDEPLLDPLAPDGSILRVHLRPFVAAGYDPAELTAAFVATAHTFKGPHGCFEQGWAAVTALAAAGELPFSLAAVSVWGEQMAALQYPAIHHSVIFRETYAPAYRVVARGCLSGALGRLSAAV